MADQKKLDRWADKLLDTGKRNNLISFKDTKASSSEVLYPDSESIFGKCSIGHLFEIFDPKIPDIDIKDTEEDGVVSDTKNDKRLSREEYKLTYASRIKNDRYLLMYSQTPNPLTAVKNIAKKAQQMQDETGINVAYMVFGFLRWNEKEGSEVFYRAPLLLVHVNVITYTNAAFNTKLNYEITAISAGETTVYVTSSDGSVSSERIRVIVPQPIEVESISFSGVKKDLVLGERIQVTANVHPGNADNKKISWASSDKSVAAVDQTGSVVTVGGGTAIITATAPNGVSESFELSVDGTKRVMTLQVTHQRDDDNNIGDDWSYITQVNGEWAGGEYTLSKGDTLSFYAEFTESDDNPDVGKASASYTVKEEDLINGFNVSMDLYVKENGGRNSGKRAHFIVNYDFKAK